MNKKVNPKFLFITKHILPEFNKIVKQKPVFTIREILADSDLRINYTKKKNIKNMMIAEIIETVFAKSKYSKGGIIMKGLYNDVEYNLSFPSSSVKSWHCKIHIYKMDRHKYINYHKTILISNENDDL